MSDWKFLQTHPPGIIWTLNPNEFEECCFVFHTGPWDHLPPEKVHSVDGESLLQMERQYNLQMKKGNTELFDFFVRLNFSQLQDKAS